MSKSLPVFENLSILADCVEKTDRLEKRFYDGIARTRNDKTGYGNCPANSLTAVKLISSECKNMVNDSHRLYHSLNNSAMKNSEMINNAEKVLYWMESGIEEYMKSHGLTSVIGSISKHMDSHLTAQMVHEEASCKNPSPVKVDVITTNDPVGQINIDSPQQKLNEANSGTGITATNKDVEDGSDMLKSPVLPPILKHYRSKSDSFCSPLDPLKGKLVESEEKIQKTSNYPMCDAINLESPQLRGSPMWSSKIESPSLAGHYFNKNLIGMGDKFMKGQSKSFFEPLQSPQLEVEAPSPELKLHSRRSILAQPPAKFDADDDVTVYSLFSRRQQHTKQRSLQSPPPPTVYHKDFPPTGCGKNSHFVLPSPETPVDILSNRNADIPSISQVYEISQDRYDTLPSHVKRIMELPKCNECLRNVMDALISWQGNEHKKVTTETTVAEVTLLGWKTKSFIFILKILGIMKEIKGTSYYEFLV